MEPITVKAAEDIIARHLKDYGTEVVPYDKALGRILAEPLYADRDLPPFNRATVDGIGIRSGAYRAGLDHFVVKGVQAAGEPPRGIERADQCMEVMTGAAVDPSMDAVIRYEDLRIENGVAHVAKIDVAAGSNMHIRGRDKRKGGQVAGAPAFISASLVGLAASIGKTALQVKKLPRVAILSTGDELIAPELTPAFYQLRRSNAVVIASVLQHYGIEPALYHLRDDQEEIRSMLQSCLEKYDVLLLSGGVSMGKFDYVPAVLAALKVDCQFHKILQRPGKPFWFGTYQEQRLVFAFPGNPVSVFLCLHRYFIPWLEKSLGMEARRRGVAVLAQDILFKPALQYFVQVRLDTDHLGQLTASPFEGNGSGDFSNLIYADAFMELPADRQIFKKGEAYKVWRYAYSL